MERSCVAVPSIRVPSLLRVGVVVLLAAYVGPFTGTMTVGGSTLDAGEGADTLVAQRSATGTVRWATSVTASAALDGSEAVAASDGGILFGSQSAPGIQLGSTRGTAITLDGTDGGTGWLAHYGPDGAPRFARTIAGTANGARRRDHPDGVTGLRRRHTPRAGERDQRRRSR
jgi:hypothetical protein